MPFYHWQAKTPWDEVVDGVMEATSPNAVMDVLRTHRFDPDVATIIEMQGKDLQDHLDACRRGEVLFAYLNGADEAIIQFSCCQCGKTLGALMNMGSVKCSGCGKVNRVSREARVAKWRELKRLIV